MNPSSAEIASQEMSRRRTVVVLVLIFTLVWCSGLILEPLLVQGGRGAQRLSFYLRFFFSFTCHQEGERCFHLFGNAMPVCARCTGIYGGFLAGLMIYPFVFGFTLRYPDRRLFLPALLPMGIEWMLGLTVFHSPNWLRLMTGFPAGLIASMAVLPALFGVVSKNAPPGKKEQAPIRSCASSLRRETESGLYPDKRTV